jgi:hypothetical protein
MTGEYMDWKFDPNHMGSCFSDHTRSCGLEIVLNYGKTGVPGIEMRLKIFTNESHTVLERSHSVFFNTRFTFYFDEWGYSGSPRWSYDPSIKYINTYRADADDLLTSACNEEIIPDSILEQYENKFGESEGEDEFRKRLCILEVNGSAEKNYGVDKEIVEKTLDSDSSETLRRIIAFMRCSPKQ